MKFMAARRELSAMTTAQVPGPQQDEHTQKRRREEK